MQIDFKKNLTNEWTALSDIITVENDVDYQIQNRGSDVLNVLEANSLPDADNFDGTLVLPYKILNYKKGTQNLYLRAFNNSCSINISAKD